MANDKRQPKTGLLGGTLLPAKAGTCPECAVAHAPELPHNLDSLFYQYHFYDEHGRWPTWTDAMAHCDAKMQAYWRTELAKAGVRVEREGPADPPGPPDPPRGDGKDVA